MNGLLHLGHAFSLSKVRGHPLKESACWYSSSATPAALPSTWYA
jgi:hypothetical protein